MRHDPQEAVTRSPGRPPEFDQSSAVSSAMSLFWRQGFERTSLADIENELGINRSTLYASFDGKAGIYEAAVESYIETMNELLIAPLIDGADGLADLLGFVEGLRVSLTDSTRPDGCLIVNAMASGQPSPAIQRYLGGLRSGFDAALQRAVERGEIPEAGCDHKASSILSSAIGLNIMAKAGCPTEEVQRLCDGFDSMIKSWHKTPAD